jgi:hypothetical protein
MEERNPTSVGAVRTPAYIFALLVALGGACTLTTNLGSLEGGRPPADDDGATADEGTGVGGDTVAASTSSGLQEDDDGGAAGVGGAGSSGGAGGSSAATGSSGGGGGGAVDCPSMPNCDECVICAEAGPCKPQLDACIADPYCEPLLTCVWSCAADDLVCVDNCHYFYGGAAAWSKYDPMTYCISCQQCTMCNYC